MQFPTEIKTKKFRKNFLIFLMLFVCGFSFLTLAQEKASSSQNIFLDSDQDGLSDEEEKIYGTDPHNRDSDNDGYSDGVEIKSGYDPKKPAPGDKIISEEKTFQNTSSEEENLTKKLAEEVLALTEKAQENGESVDMSSVQELLEKTFPAQDDEDAFSEENFVPLISEDEIKIKKQNYSGFSKDKAKRKMKDDATQYFAAVFYVMSSNSPEPITSKTNLSSIINSFSSQINQAFNLRSTEKTEKFKESGEKILSQIKDIEVPEDLLDIHISALSFAKYAIQMENYIKPNLEDPVSDIQNLSKITGLISSAISFSSQVEEKLSAYELSQEDITEEMEKLGF